MYLKEYRICMPITVEEKTFGEMFMKLIEMYISGSFENIMAKEEIVLAGAVSCLSHCDPVSSATAEYRIGQLYMIAKHSHEQSQKGEGVEVVTNEPCEHPEYGKGQYTEKRIHLSSKLPTWIRSMIPAIFYITEKAWNYYPHTITEYTCSFIPRFVVNITTKYENNNGSTDNCLNLTEEELSQREVDFIDIVNDPIDESKYKEEEDLTKFKSKKTGRGPLDKHWRDTTTPIMCSYKVVRCYFEVWGLQTKVEGYAQRTCRDVNLLGHRQAISWMDDWIDMSLDDIRSYEGKMQKETNEKVMQEIGDIPPAQEISID